MKEYTVVKNHSVAHVAVISPKMLRAWNNMKEYTVMRKTFSCPHCGVKSSVEEHEIIHSGGKTIQLFTL